MPGEHRAALLKMAEAWVELERQTEREKNLLKPSEARNDPS
jgi:hypothetical protein